MPTRGALETHAFRAARSGYSTGMSGSGGVDRASSMETVRDAFRRVGLELEVRRADAGWQAVTVLNGAAHVAGSGNSPDEAARVAWTAYVRRNGGVGQS